MAFWPFSRRKKKADKLQEKDPNSSAATTTTREATRNNPGNGAPSEEPKRRTFKSFRRETKPTAVSPSPPESKPPVPEKSALRPPVPPVPLETNSSTTDPFDEKLAAFEEENRPVAGPSREPFAELQNLEAPPPAVFERANTGSQTSLQPEHHFTVMPINAEVPTLRPKRDSKSGDTARRKSSKRKSGTRDREQEIKSMTSPIPIPKRPQAFSSSPLARDTKRVPGGLNRHFERPTSEVSLPVPDSVRSSMSGDSEWQQSYQVSAMDALSPRPTIRYAESPRLGSKEHRASRASVRRDKAPAAIPEEPFNTKARMEDLADDLDAKALRELMDRDRRRRERKKKSEQDKLQRKLQRKAERQQKAEADAQDASRSRHRGDVEMRDADPAGPSSAQDNELAESSAQAAQRQTQQSPSSWLQDPSREHLPSPPADPFNDPTMRSHLDLGPESEQASINEPIIETAKAIRLSSASMSPPMSPVPKQTRGQSSLSNLVASSTQDVPEPSPLPEPEYLQPPEIRRDSESSSRAEGSSWTSFFRRRATKSQRKSSDKDRHTPSEFSNTSRESFARSKQTPPGPVVQRSFRRDGTPQRTQSKFREDLPELPMSPPRSRVQSPEMNQAPSPYIDDQSKVENLNDHARVSTPIEDVHPAFREQISINQSLRSPSPEGPASGLLSQSLASIDSEGSWLSGRHPKRSSIPISSLRESQASLSQQLAEDNEQPIEEPNFARHEINAGTIRGPGALSAQLRQLRTSSGGESDLPEVFPGDETGEGAMRYDTVKGRKPNIVQRSPYFKSREGLLDDYTNAEEASPVSPISADSPDTPERDQASTSIHRATSVDYGRRGHVRQLSAGSARLLDIPARTSSDTKRNSLMSDKTKSPLSETFAEEDVDEPSASSPSPQNE